jgi:hypothetical protein
MITKIHVKIYHCLFCALGYRYKIDKPILKIRLIVIDKYKTIKTWNLETIWKKKTWFRAGCGS